LALCADALAAAGEVKQAEAVYLRLYWRKQLPQTRAVALIGLVGLWQESAVPLVIASLQSDERIVRTAAATAAREMSGPGPTDDLWRSIHELSVEAGK
jgi:hypothetical protein